jgi:WD40 repeat protein
MAPMPTPGAEAPCLTYRGHSSYIWSVDWAPSGQWIASGSWGQIHLWDPSSRTVRATYHGHVGDVYGLAYSPDGTRIASGGRDRTLQVWNTGDAILRDGDQSMAPRGLGHA